MRYRVNYKDGSSEIIKAATYAPDGDFYIFKDEGGDSVSSVLRGEVRSITKEGPSGLA